jgi:hypothetical protein
MADRKVAAKLDFRYQVLVALGTINRKCKHVEYPGPSGSSGMGARGTVVFF